MSLKREELDQLGAVALKAVKSIDQTLTVSQLCKVFSRLYCKLLKDKKLQQETT